MFIKSFNEVGINDIKKVGGKNASLGELTQALRPKGINIPEGFIITTKAFNYFFEKNKLNEKIKFELDKTDLNNISALRETGQKIRKWISSVEIPNEVKEAVRNAYATLSHMMGTDELEVAVRSSATAEDLPTLSFAGQQDTFLNIKGENSLLKSVAKCYASLFNDRAISYRYHHGFEHRKISLSVGVQRMIRSDMASSGVIFTIDPESGANNVILLSSSWGLGENIVAGKIDPDEFIVSKSLLDIAPKPILKKRMGSKQTKLVYDDSQQKGTRNIETSSEEQNSFSLNDEEIIKLAEWSVEIEKYFSEIYLKNTPMDIEWAKDGNSNQLYILQARPETVHSMKNNKQQTIMSLEEKSRIILKGQAVGNTIGVGKARIIKEVSELENFENGEILVAEMTNPDWEPVMKKASAIITNKGGRTCHAAIISREHGVPCVVGSQNATTLIKTGQEITVSCAEGDQGMVYEGILPVKKEEITLRKIKDKKFEIFMNIANPDKALKLSTIPVDGVGLARTEFIIAQKIRIHPIALIRLEELNDEKIKKEIKNITKGYEKDPSRYFVEHLAQGMGMIAGAFYPRPVIIRMSDFKTNEYANLIGGELFEPKEENPMIGFRGASRFYSEFYRKGFALECAAVLKARKEMGLKNIKIMIPFCRTTTEAIKVINEMKENGLESGEEQLEIYMMCEIPSNVIDMESFSKFFDGFSIGSNDLTQLTLGVDRSSEILGNLFNERDPSALKMIGMAIDNAKGLNKPIGICGEAPSNYPDIAKFIIEKGINSISLAPDAIFNIMKNNEKLKDSLSFDET